MSGYIEGLFLRQFNIPKSQRRGFANRPLNVGMSEEFFFASQLNSRYREGYDRHDTVKGTRESVNTPVKKHGQEQYWKYGTKEKQEVIDHTKTIQESKTAVESIPGLTHRAAQL